MDEGSLPTVDATVAKRRGRPPKRPAEASVLLAPPAGEPAPVVIAAAPEPVVPAPVTPADASVEVAEQAPAPAIQFVPPAAVPAVHAVEETIMDPVNTTANAAQDTADKGRALFADWNSRTREAMERSTKMFESLGDFYKGNLEAFVESSRIAVKGFESFGQHAAEVTRKSVEDATAATKTLSQTKSPTEFLKLQGDYARSTFDLMVAETSRSTEAVLKLAGDVAQPVANRLAVAADKMKVA